MLRFRKLAHGFYLPALLAAALALLLKADHGPHFADRHLWAEDGTVFLSSAHELGLDSLLAPYAGYYHLYPRIISMLANLAPLTERPEVLLAGWLAAFLVMILAAVRLVRHLGGSRWHAATIALLIALQPQNGEVLFTITNAQWHLGAALCFMALTPSRQTTRSSGVFWALVCLVVGLTGPFVIIIASVIILSGLPLRTPWVHQRPLYTIIAITSVLQALLLANSSRVAKLNESSHLGELQDWLLGLWRIISFGADSPLEYVLAILMIGGFIILACRRNLAPQQRLVALCLSGTGFAMALAAMFSLKPDVLLATALGEGHRYTWIPYTMLVTAGGVLCMSGPPIERSVMLLFTLLLFGFNLGITERHDMNYRSFVRLAEVSETVVPINPAWPVYPGWHIRLPPDSERSLALERIQGADLPPAPILPRMHELAADTSIIEPLEAEDGARDYIIHTGVDCTGATDIGVELDLARPHAGYVTLYWSDNPTFDERFSFQRWYPQGQVKAQFAFPGFQGQIFLRIKPLGTPQAPTIVQNLRIYCLD